MIGRADIEGSKSNVAMNAWLPQASSRYRAAKEDFSIATSSVYPGVKDLNRGTLPGGGRLYLKQRQVTVLAFAHTLPVVETRSPTAVEPCRLLIVPILQIVTRVVSLLFTSECCSETLGTADLCGSFQQPGVSPHIASSPSAKQYELAKQKPYYLTTLRLLDCFGLR
jgi:hypothetical protein